MDKDSGGVIKHSHTHLSFGCSIATPSNTGNSFCRGHDHRGDTLRGGGPTKVKGDKGHVTKKEIQSRIRGARQTKQNSDLKLMKP